MIYTYLDECRQFLPDSLDGINILIINEQGFAAINKQQTELFFESIQPNTPCVLNNTLYAIWDMRNDYEFWDEVDIACGIAHELFHCVQIKYKKWKKCSKDIYFLHVPDEKEILNADYFFNLPQSIKDTIEIEGMALYFELFCKSKIKKISMLELLEEYKLFACHNIKFIPYYVGAVRIYHEYCRCGKALTDYFGKIEGENNEHLRS